MPEAVALRDVLDRLHARGLIDDPAIARIADYLPHAAGTATTPWYVKLLAGIGAWIAAICFIAFLCQADLLDDEAASLLAWGLGFVAGATALHFFIRNVFVVQLALALSMAGHIMTLLGASAWLEDGLFWGILPDTYAGAALAAAILCPILYPLYRNSSHRFLSCLLVMITATAWMLSTERHHGLHVLVLVETVGIGLCLARFYAIRWLRPMAYAMAVALPATLLLALASHEQVQTPWWPSKAVLTLGLIWLCLWAAGGIQSLRREPIVLAVVAAAALGAVSTPGILAGIGLLVLGYVRQDRPLMGLAVVFLATFIVGYYYDLDVTLLTKSWILAASGGTLILARLVLSRRPWAREAAA